MGLIDDLTGTVVELGVGIGVLVLAGKFLETAFSSFCLDLGPFGKQGPGCTPPGLPYQARNASDCSRAGGVWDSSQNVCWDKQQSGNPGQSNKPTGASIDTGGRPYTGGTAGHPTIDQVVWCGGLQSWFFQASDGYWAWCGDRSQGRICGVQALTANDIGTVC